MSWRNERGLLCPKGRPGLRRLKTPEVYRALLGLAQSHSPGHQTHLLFLWWADHFRASPSNQWEQRVLFPESHPILNAQGRYRAPPMTHTVRILRLDSCLLLLVPLCHLASSLHPCVHPWCPSAQLHRPCAWPGPFTAIKGKV